VNGPAGERRTGRRWSRLTKDPKLLRRDQSNELTNSVLGFLRPIDDEANNSIKRNNNKSKHESEEASDSSCFTFLFVCCQQEEHSPPLFVGLRG
jgi:hypothetical protein